MFPAFKKECSQVIKLIDVRQQQTMQYEFIVQWEYCTLLQMLLRFQYSFSSFGQWDSILALTTSWELTLRLHYFVGNVFSTQGRDSNLSMEMHSKAKWK